MMSDSAIPHMELNTNSSEPAQVNQRVLGEDGSSVLPEAEVDAALHFISSPPVSGDAPHFISGSIYEDEVPSSLLLENAEVVESNSREVSTPVIEDRRVDLLSDDGEVRITEIFGNDAGVDGVSISCASVGARLATDDFSVGDRVVEVEDDSLSVIVPLVSDRVVEVEDDSLSVIVPLVSDRVVEVEDDGLSAIVPLVSSGNKSEASGDGVKETEQVSVVSGLGELDLDTLDLLPLGIGRRIQVQLKSEAERLVIVLPSESQLSTSEYSWSEVWQQLKQRLNAGDRLRVANTNVHLVAGDRLLDGRQLQELAESLYEVQLQLKSVATSRRQTAIASVTSGYSVEQIPLQSNSLSSSKPSATPMKEPLYMEMTIRSGVEIRHPGTVVVLGDVNPGGVVVADGDILVWGRLRGVAHAGASGNNDCLIMALQMEPTQLRIADAVARAPEKSPKHFHAEVAYITNEAIRIAKAADFSRSNRIK